ncbi:MAG: aspartate aminotransferase family protein [Chitinispirillaceae bacterium]|nr:aspartate aminotransferase family protein [Chitinispirillaceae bacterium]
MNTKKINSLFVPTYKRDGAPLTHGKGSLLFDAGGTAYLDFGCGIAVNSLGHGHPALQKALFAQGRKLIHSSNLYFSQPQIDLAKLLIKHSFGKRVFFCNSGTEANEAAIKFARKWAKKQSPGKYHILSFSDGFHGRTYGALSATAQDKFHAGFEPLAGGFHFAPFNDIKAVKKLLAAHRFAAIFVEPLQGEGGVNSATAEFLTFLRKAADKHKCALVFDEIQCGMGRTGTLWAYEQYRVIPDMMTLAKPIGGGLPLGAVVCREDIALSLGAGDHGTTFGGNPVACALGVVVMNIIADKGFLKQVRVKGAYLLDKLTSLQKLFPAIESVLGSGLLIGVRMKADPAPIIAGCKKAGLLLIKANRNTVRFIPPLTVKKTEIDRAVSIFTSVLKKQPAKE